MAVTTVPHDTWESVENGMTLADLLRAMRRWWPIVLIGAISTVAVAVLATRAEPVYHARTEMVFLAPPSARYPNELITRTESLIITAGIIAKRINGADLQIKFGSPIVNPVGAPDDGRTTWISLLDTGTQWVPIFDNQILVVDAVGATPAEVSDRIDAAAALVQSELRGLQREMKVAPVNEITTQMSPAAPVIEEITGSRVRAIGMTLAIGGILTMAVVIVLEVRARAARARAEETWTALLPPLTLPDRR